MADYGAVTPGGIKILEGIRSELLARGKSPEEADRLLKRLHIVETEEEAVRLADEVARRLGR